MQRGVVAAAVVALGVVIGAPVPVSAEEPSPTPFMAAGDASPIEIPGPQAGDRRPGTIDAIENIVR